MSCDGLLERLGFECREVGNETISVGTPFVFADGEPINFYLVDRQGKVSISDNADTLMHLAGVGIDISDRRRWTGIRQIMDSFGIELTEWGEITSSASK